MFTSILTQCIEEAEASLATWTYSQSLGAMAELPWRDASPALGVHEMARDIRSRSWQVRWSDQQIFHYVARSKTDFALWMRRSVPACCAILLLGRRRGVLWDVRGTETARSGRLYTPPRGTATAHTSITEPKCPMSEESRRRGEQQNDRDWPVGGLQRGGWKRR